MTSTRIFDPLTQNNSHRIAKRKAWTYNKAMDNEDTPIPYKYEPPLPKGADPMTLTEAARENIKEAYAALARVEQARKNPPSKEAIEFALRVLLRDSDMTIDQLNTAAMAFRYERFGGNAAAASRSLGIGRTTFYRWQRAAAKQQDKENKES